MTWDIRDLRSPAADRRPEMTTSSFDGTEAVADPALPPLNLLDPYYGLEPPSGAVEVIPPHLRHEMRAAGLVDTATWARWRHLLLRGQA